MTVNTVVSETDLRQQTQHSPATTLWTLTRTNLYLAWRRVMSKVLLLILLGLFAVIVGFLVIEYNAVASAPASTFNECPPRAAQCPQPTAAQLEAIRQQALDGIRSTVTFPTSLGLAGGYTGFVGALLIAILAGTLVGSEYGLGTLRLSLARGLSRAQTMAGQVIALAIVALATGIGMLLIGTLVGVTIGPALGGSIPDLTAEGLRELTFYGLALSLQLWVYALFALAFATLGRSAAAGIGGAIGFLFLEAIASPIFRAIGASLGGDWGSRLQHTPDFFPNTNLGSLVTRASEAPIGLNTVGDTTLDLTHAAIVVAVYIVVLIGGSYLLYRLRDVTD